jgi:hypothetical protein
MSYRNFLLRAVQVRAAVYKIRENVGNDLTVPGRFHVEGKGLPLDAV